MRLPIYKPEDFFGHPEDPLYLDVSGVRFESEVPLCYNYDHLRPPIGRVTDIQVNTELDSITGKVEFFETGDEFFHKLVVMDEQYLAMAGESGEVELRYRLGGYYTVTQQVNRDGKKVVDQSVLRAVSLIPEPVWPWSEKNANRGDDSEESL